MSHYFPETEPNLATIALWLQMQKFIELSKNPILPFSEATSENFDNHIFYDEKHNVSKNENYKAHSVVLDAWLDELHHDIVSTYNLNFPSLEILVAIPEESSDPYLRIFDPQTNVEFFIEDGSCYEP